MADIICSNCKHVFASDNTDSYVTNGAAALAFGSTAAYFGSGIGIAAGPLGAVNGWFVCAVVGGLVGWLTADQFRLCPKCNQTFKT